MHKITTYLSIKNYQNYCLSLVKNVFTFVHPAAFTISVREIPPLNAFDVDA